MESLRFEVSYVLILLKCSELAKTGCFPWIFFSVLQDDDGFQLNKGRFPTLSFSLYFLFLPACLPACCIATKQMFFVYMLQGKLRYMVNRLRSGSQSHYNYTFTTSTSPKMQGQGNAPTAAKLGEERRGRGRGRGRGSVKGDFVPVYVALGMIVMSLTIGLHTAAHELMYSPEVHLRKSRRETLPEVEDPDTVVDEGDKFIKKSWFRKMAHVQDLDLLPRPTPIHEDPLTMYPSFFLSFFLLILKS